jgi:hypothetical protein
MWPTGRLIAMIIRHGLAEETPGGPSIIGYSERNGDSDVSFHAFGWLDRATLAKMLSIAVEGAGGGALVSPR